MNRVKKFFDDDRVYFKTCRASIIEQNGTMLTDGCAVYAGVLLFYTALTAITDQPDILKYMYYAFDIIHLALCVAVALRPKHWKRSYMPTQVFCLMLEVSVLSFFALEGAFTSADQHSLYVPIAILLVQLLFIHKTAAAIIVNFAYAIVFAALSRAYKQPQAYINDIYIAVATVISSCIGYFLIANTRHNEGAAMRKYEALSKMDSLTGVYNRRAFEDMCQSALTGDERGCAFLIIDIDGFKNINAEAGYEVGDEVLKDVGFAIKKTFREQDIAGRFGGDKFVVMMIPCEEVQKAAERLAALNEELARMSFSHKEIKPTCGAGIAMGKGNDDIHALFSRAQRALETAKQKGPACVGTA